MAATRGSEHIQTVFKFHPQASRPGALPHEKKVLGTGSIADWVGPRTPTRASKTTYSSAPVSTGNTFLDLPRLRETADNTESYI
jgi:hypothetical protein